MDMDMDISMNMNIKHGHGQNAQKRKCSMDMDILYGLVILILRNYVESYSGLQVNPESDCTRGHNCCPDRWVRLQGSLKVLSDEN